MDIRLVQSGPLESNPSHYSRVNSGQRLNRGLSIRLVNELVVHLSCRVRVRYPNPNPNPNRVTLTLTLTLDFA